MSDHLKKMIVTATHYACHGFTAPTRLGAKVPDNLARCNTVESERGVVHSKDQGCRKQETFYKKEQAAPKTIEPSSCRAVSGPS